MTPVYFEAEYSQSDPLFHTCLYRGDDRFDFTQNPNGSYHDLPNISFLISDRSGVKTPAAEGKIGIRYSGTSGITIEGKYETCRVYSASGILIGEYYGQDVIPVQYSEEGILVVEVVSGEEYAVKKIAVTR